MRNRLLAILLAGTMFAGVSYPAKAEPITASIAAFAATQLGGIVVSTAVSVAASFASSLLKNMFAPTPSKPKPNLAMRLSVATGGVVPQSFLIGDWATAGSLNYRGSWGVVDGTPNAYYVEERILSDLPMPELTGFWFGPQKATILKAEPHGEYGWPIFEARRNGVDHMWVRYRDGTQTTADAYLRSKFAGGQFPYAADMVGRGRATAIVTRKVPNEENRDVFPANLEYKFETSGIALYDLSKDSTAGGFGNHRWDNPATWEPSGNTAVQVYNILRGIRYGQEWLFGLQTLPATRLPTSAWIAAINECNLAMALAAGGTEAQFRTGAEVSVDMEAAGVIDELLAGATGRIAEVGGVYKALFGAPGAAVMSFTDRDIVVTREQGYSPFPRIEQTFNGIRPKYVNPASGWDLADAPARYSPEQETADGGRQLMADITLKAVNSVTRTQRLVKTAHEEQRRWRRHQLGFAPIFSELEPLDAISWTSAENGYENKKFLVTDLEDEPTYLQGASLQEWDPADYDYDANTEEQVGWSAPIGIVRPPAQVIIGFGVEPATVDDDQGRPRRPAVRFTWNGAVEDVRRVGLQLRTRLGPVEDRKLVYSDGSDRVSDGQAVVAAAGILSNQKLEGRGLYYPRGPRQTEWTDWLPVDTPEIGLSLEDLDTEFREVVGLIGSIGGGTLSDRLDDLLERLARLAAVQTSDTIQAYTIRRELAAEIGEDRAYFLEQVNVLVDADQALASLVTLLNTEFDDNVAFVGQQLQALSTADSAMATQIGQVEVSVGSITAGGIIRMDASAGPAGWQTKISAVVRATVGGNFYEAGWYTLVNSNGDNVFAVKANSFYFLNDSGGVITSPFYISGGTVYIKTAVIQDLTVTGAKIANNAITDNFSAKDAAIFSVYAGNTASVLNCDVFVTAGSKVNVIAGVQGYRVDTGNAGNLFTRLKRDGTAIDEKFHRFPTSSAGESPAQLMFACIDEPSAGWHAYSLECFAQLGAGRCDVSSRSIIALVTKK